MQFSQQFRGFAESWKNCLQSVRYGRTFLIFFLYAAVQMSVLFVLMNFAYKPFSSILVPVIRKIFGEPALHYPGNFLALPILFDWANILLSGFIGILIVSSSTMLFASIYQNKDMTLGKSLKATMSKYLVLFAVWLVETFVLLVVFAVVPRTLASLEIYSGLVNKAAIFCSGVLFGGLFAYTTASVILARDGIFRAFGKSVRFFAKAPIVTLLLVGIPSLIRFPLDILAGKPLLIIDKFNPEVVGLVIGLGVLVSVFSNYFMIGTITRFFLITEKN